jgi:predicted AAA+ superfamily ATPase
MKPWHQVVTPRKDLREGKPLDASEFAIHLQQVKAGTAPGDYIDPERFFQRTYLTRGLKDVAIEVLRRLSGETVNAAPVINLTTQFGGGKTHALVMLYHLLNGGPVALAWPGVQDLVKQAGIRTVPHARIATFVGTDFDPISGRSGPGEPRRMTPWGDIAWQLAGQPGLDAVREQDRLRVRPGGDVLRELLPRDRPVLILMDEVLNFLNVARAIKAGDTAAKESSLASQFMAFVQALTEEATGRAGLVLVMALPKSETEMSAEDQEDFRRLQRLSSRVDRPYILSEGLEISEIIRRRLFEDLGPATERRATSRAYAKAVSDDRQLLPQWFAFDRATDAFEASYPFHPTVLSVFERKWQTAPGFQRTRGVLRMLALWVSQTYQAAYRGGRRDPLITLGAAPLEDPAFRATILEQLGESRLEATITTDIAGTEAHAVQLDQAALPAIQGARLHRAVASAIFFESSGGQVREEATLPEVRLDLDGPDFELGHIETAISALTESCYYLAVEGARYHFSLQPNLNMLLADIRVGLADSPLVSKRMRDEVQAVLKTGGSIERRFFPETSGAIPNVPVLVLVVLSPEQALAEGERGKTMAIVKDIFANAGNSSRAFKSALFFAAPDSPARLRDAARKLLAWQTLDVEADRRGLNDLQLRQVAEQIKGAQRDLREAVWQTYNAVVFLDSKGDPAILDLGLLHSSSADSLAGYIELRLRQQDLLVETVSPDFLVRHWPPGLPRWPMRTLRGDFFASPLLPRLTSADTLRATVARGVSSGAFGLGRLAADDRVTSLRFAESIESSDVDFSEEAVLVQREEAAALKSGAVSAIPMAAASEPHASPQPLVQTGQPGGGVGVTPKLRGLHWVGEVPSTKWSLFYNKIVARLIPRGDVRLRVEVDARPVDGLSESGFNEIRQGFADLGLPPPEPDGDVRQ